MSDSYAGITVIYVVREYDIAALRYAIRIDRTRRYIRIGGSHGSSEIFTTFLSNARLRIMPVQLHVIA